MMMHQTCDDPLCVCVFFAGAGRSQPVTSKLQQPKNLWKDPMFLASVGVALMVLGVQGMRVGLFSQFLSAR